MEKRRFASKKDFLVLAAALAVGAAAYACIAKGGGGLDNYGEILLDNKVIRRVDLSADREFSLEEKPQVLFSVKDGAIAFKASDCPDKICVRTGYIKSRGQSAVCLPNRLTVRIVGGSGDIDIYSG